MTDISKPITGGRMLLSDEMIQVFYRLLAAFLICAALTILTNSFFSLGNILNVLRQASLLFFIASGLTLVVLTGGLDLSIGANVAISACIAGTVIHQTGSPTLGVLTGIGVGGAVGMLNGVMVTALRIPSFIATYGMLWVLHGITYWYMGGETMHGFPAGFRQIGSGYFLGLPIPVYLLLVFLAIGTIFAQRTTWGQEIYAIGANPVAARLSGIPVARRLLLVYTVSGAMAGLASIIFLARLNSAEADIGESLTLPAIAAVLIGGTSLFGGLGTVFGTFVGALILTLVLNGMNLLSVNASWQPLVTGVIVILAVWLDMKTRRRAA
ncbi:ABC transporter permease [Tardiphaga sp. 20_F10_N6_6]|jgi:ribose transport system permease protein|uniref:ABC transporter permease n=1 Tax=Tardiphaga robiniae TaxID=943830 RepID=A0A7G6U0V2_9BRAD|nr:MULTISPECIES: ABC transporter permease [Nitrobacteraceae]MDR6663200.1 ribose transport system permease protein [Tardiphaga robiniae]NUU40624.1 ABC transporter permease [Tardiphaga robiniae]QND72634.1 ABC transporter permease [Tardiphaga robiniae]UFS76500.1 ABC transporter permease [Tardiphaga sp. 37S4]WNV11489.1 ABC transporter permease [Tardiphaga sp. 709]